jgi:hypothetical protein
MKVKKATKPKKKVYKISNSCGSKKKGNCNEVTILPQMKTDA